MLSESCVLWWEAKIKENWVFFCGVESGWCGELPKFVTDFLEGGFLVSDEWWKVVILSQLI